MAFFAPYWKALLAFLALVATNLLTTLSATGAVWPDTTHGWVTLVGTTVVGTFAVWAKGNTAAGKHAA